MTPRPFLVLGAMKSGTTTVETLLAGHPEVTIAVEKETTAFDGSDRAALAARQINGATTAVAGEVSTGYMQHPWVTSDPTQAAELLGPELRVIVVLREPLARARSHWRHWEQLGRNTASLSESLTDTQSALVAFSRYHHQLARWTDVLPSNRMLVLRLEDYETDPDAWQRSLTEFLQITPVVSKDMVTVNSADSRVVARGLGQRVSRSMAYRTLIRPLIPQRGRRLGTRLLGGARGGGLTEEALTADQEERFYSLIAEDARQLRARWPHATWTSEGS